MSKIKRYPDWPERLAKFIDAARIKPFVWGENDCCLFAMDCVQAITGQDLAQPYRGYTSQTQALRLLNRSGGVAGIAEAVAAKYDIPEITPLTAQRGDVCLFDIGRGNTLGIRAGEHIYAPGFKGLIGFPALQAVRAWRIG